MAEIADRFSIDLDIRHHRDFGERVFDFAAGVDGRFVEFPEHARETQQARIVEPLAAEAQHQVLVPRGFDRLESLRSYRFGKVNANDIGAQTGAGRDCRNAGCAR